MSKQALRETIGFPWWSDRRGRFDPGFVAEFESRQGIAEGD